MSAVPREIDESQLQDILKNMNKNSKRKHTRKQSPRKTKLTTSPHNPQKAQKS